MNNKLIEKLAVQSLVYVDTGLDDGKELIFSKEKFVEMIVAECVNICNTTTDRGYLNGVVAGHKIKEHFGVRE